MSDPSSAAGGPAQRLQAPPWIGAAIYAAAVTGLVCYAAWPGLMSYDSLFAYEEGLYGIQTMLWPPLHAYMFGLSATVGAGAGGVLALQTFVLFWAGALVLFSLVRRRWVAWMLCVGFMLSFPYVPPQLGTLMAQWRDVPTASFCLLAVALWLQAARLRSRILLALAILALGVAVGLRYNAVILVFGVCALMIWRPWLGAGGRAVDRAGVAAALALVFGLGWASTQWRLPDLVRMPSPASLGGTQLFDVIGISACTGTNYLPVVVSSGLPLTPVQVRQIYDPTHLLRTLRKRPGIPRVLESNGAGQVPVMWRRLLTQETGCYLAHRRVVMVEQLGMADHAPFYAVHDGIDANRFGLQLANPDVAEGVRAYINRNAGEAWRRPYLLYLGALIAAGLAAWLRRDRALLMGAMLAGALAYPALLFVAAPAADARYIFPSNTLASLMMLIAGGFVAERWLDARSAAKAGAGAAP